MDISSADGSAGTTFWRKTSGISSVKVVATSDLLSSPRILIRYGACSFECAANSFSIKSRFSRDTFVLFSRSSPILLMRKSGWRQRRWRG